MASHERDPGARQAGGEEGLAPERETHPAQPEQVETGFGEGYSPGRAPDAEHIGTFAEGVDDKPDTPEEKLVGNFATGVDEHPDSPEETRERDFAEGIERPRDAGPLDDRGDLKDR